jgi:uncharacterized membrane protein YhiD involved in acid resistance
MMVIGSNIARAFSLVGALSIVRFRNPVKETRDLGFIFLIMAIGMACGTRFYVLATLATLVISAVILSMTRFDLFVKDNLQRILRVRLPADMRESALAPVLARYVNDRRLLSVEAVTGGIFREFVYSVMLRHGVDVNDFLESLSQVNEQNKVVLLVGQQEVDL